MDKPIPEAVRAIRDVLFRVYMDHDDFKVTTALLHDMAVAVSSLTAAQQPDHIVDATKMVAQQQGHYCKNCLGIQPETCLFNPQRQQQGQAGALDRMAIRLLVEAGFVTEDKANEALRIAHGFDKGPLAPPSAPVGVDGMPTWRKQRPTRPGVYGVRGFNLDADPEDQFEAIVAIRLYEDELVCNLHESPSEDDLDNWMLVSDISEELEWCEFVAALAQQPAAVDEAMVERACANALGEMTESEKRKWWEYYPDDADDLRDMMRRGLTAALATQHQEPTT